MNKLEAAFCEELDRRVAAGELLWRSKHEALKLRLADLTFLTPDFYVLQPDGEAHLLDVKGGLVPEKNRQKLKLVAELHPFRVFMVRRESRKDGDGRRLPPIWTYEEI